MSDHKIKKQQCHSTSKTTASILQSNLPQGMCGILNALEDGSTVAVVTLLGSLCPITKAHTQAFIEARRFFLAKDLDNTTNNDNRTTGLENFQEVVGFISVNPDRYVSAKFERIGEILPLKFEERVELVQLAIADMGHPWISMEDFKAETWRILQSCFPHLSFVHYYMNGADDVVKKQKWRKASKTNRFITMGRKGDTEKVAQAAAGEGVNPAYFIMGSDLPDISSTAARDALFRRDYSALAEMLHPTVMERCLDHQSWQR
uniref:Cytidyltransferase-like domain-containing protein n=1 Tax=Ditylum brightwellii TaxID=49249 RepID=A0A7S4S305_9STRA